MSDNAKRVTRATEAELDQKLKRLDEPRWLALRYAPDQARGALVALYLLDIELARSTRTSEPMIGLIRLQWWRELIEALPSGRALDSHELLPALADRGWLGKTDPLTGDPVLLALIDAWAGSIDPGQGTSSAPASVLAELAIGLLHPEASASDVQRAKSIVTREVRPAGHGVGAGLDPRIWPAILHVAAQRKNGEQAVGVAARLRVLRAMLTKRLP